ncbi:hypothetical protein [Arthrobacter sp. LjRoot14]|uniref:hypothetical protein n=1 Tax=Arthrobacter sp. LjRoot14 TaxID=3342265 RepID=UPI003ECF9DD4
MLGPHQRGHHDQAQAYGIQRSRGLRPVLAFGLFRPARPGAHEQLRRPDYNVDHDVVAHEQLSRTDHDSQPVGHPDDDGDCPAVVRSAVVRSRESAGDAGTYSAGAPGAGGPADHLLRRHR